MIYNYHQLYLVYNPDSWALRAANLFSLPWLVLKETYTQQRQFTWIKVDQQKVSEHPYDCKWPRWIQVGIAVTFLIPATLLYYAVDLVRIVFLNSQVHLIGKEKNDAIKKYFFDRNHSPCNEAREQLKNLQVSNKNALGHFETIPKEILNYLFTYVIGDDAKQRAIVSKVCKAFYKAANTPTVWQSLYAASSQAPLDKIEQKQDIEFLRREVIWLCDPFYKELYQFMKKLFSDDHFYTNLPVIEMMTDEMEDKDKERLPLDRIAAIVGFLNAMKKSSLLMWRMRTQKGYQGIFLKCERSRSCFDDCQHCSDRHLFFDKAIDTVWLMVFPICVRKNLRYIFTVQALAKDAGGNRWNDITLGYGINYQAFLGELLKGQSKRIHMKNSVFPDTDFSIRLARQ